MALKGQILVDFLAEILQQGANPGDTDWWILNVDGASRKTGAGVGLTLKASTGKRIEQAIMLVFPPSNNEMKYEAILAGIDLKIFVSSIKIIIQSDSQLGVGQINEEYEIPNQRMDKYVSLVKL